MQTAAHKPTIMECIHEHRLTITATASSGLLVGAASAGTLAGNISPILADIVDLMPSLLSLVVGVVPILITLALVGFILGIFDGILGKIRL